MFSTDNHFEISGSILLLLQNLPLLVERVSLCSLQIIALKLVCLFVTNLPLLVERVSLCSLQIITLNQWVNFAIVTKSARLSYLVLHFVLMMYVIIVFSIFKESDRKLCCWLLQKSSEYFYTACLSSWCSLDLSKQPNAFDKGCRPETPISILISWYRYFSCVILIYPIVPHAPAFLHSFLLLVTVVVKGIGPKRQSYFYYVVLKLFLSYSYLSDSS